jgi:hypothetical protein
MGLADIVSLGGAGTWGEMGPPANTAVNPGPVNGQNGTLSWLTCHCAGTAGNGLQGASATGPGGPGGAGGLGFPAFGFTLAINEIQTQPGANVLTVLGAGGTGGTGGTGGDGGSGARGGNAGQDPASCQSNSWDAPKNAPCPLTYGGTGGTGTVAGNGGTGGTGGSGPTIRILYTAANKQNLQSNMSVSVTGGAGGGGGGGGGAGLGGPGGNNEIIQGQRVTYADNGQAGPNTASPGSGGATGATGQVMWVEQQSS